MSKRLTALFAGLLYPFGFAPYGWWPLVPASIAVLFLCLRDSKPRAAFVTGFCYGFGLFGYGVSWLYVSVHTYGMTPMWLAIPLTALFCAGMALYFGLLGSLHAWLGHRLLSFAGLWLLIDALRGWFLTGFPWLYPGYALIDTPLAHFASLGGIWLVSLLTVLTAMALLSLRHWRRQWPLPLLVLCCWLAGTQLSPDLWVHRDNSGAHRVSLVQGNIPQDMKWLMTQQQATRDIYADLTASIKKPGLVIWPESAITEFYQDAMPFLLDEGEQVSDRGGALITGVPWRLSLMHGYQYFNSIAVVSGGEGVYNKQKLVPFGEYVPLEDLMRGLIPFFDLPMSSFTRGSPDQENLRALGMTIAPFICYEVLYPDLVAERSQDADVMLTVSNDAWFGTSDGPLQHFQMTRMRTLETGRWLLRDTNNGITAIIDNHGKVRARLPHFQRAVLQGSFETVHGSTPFMLAGAWPIWGLALALCLPAWWRRYRPAKSSVEELHHERIQEAD